MALSALDLFSIGIGPSSSHTVGPMRAAARFLDRLEAEGVSARVARVAVELYGSLGLTGRGHGSDKAVILGLEGEDPRTVDTSTADDRVQGVRDRGELALGGHRVIRFDEATDLVLHRRRSLPGHPNGMTFAAFDEDGAALLGATYFSVGGGFVVDDSALGADRITDDDRTLPYPFVTGADLLAHCASTGMRVSDVVLANEAAWRPEAETRARLLEIWAAMRECVRHGIERDGVLPGGLKVPRRAAALHRALQEGDARGDTDPLRVMDWVNLFAIAVNEENASGGRVVTAPTNGAAGIVPAVLHYVDRFTPAAEDDDAVVRFLLAAAAVGMIVKQGASLSGAEVGCQGEVGSACAMAAAGLAEVLGGTPAQVENAAEIGIEHNLGLTCDPIGGLVQIPCIERNAVGASKAITAARLALAGDGSHRVSLDKAVRTMRATGRDMHAKYKETSRGGLAVNIIEC